MKRLQFDAYLGNIKDETLFIVHGKRIRFAKNSIGMMTNRNPIRVGIVWLVMWKWFDRAVIGLILLNSFLLGIKDY